MKKHSLLIIICGIVTALTSGCGIGAAETVPERLAETLPVQTPMLIPDPEWTIEQDWGPLTKAPSEEETEIPETTEAEETSNEAEPESLPEGFVLTDDGKWFYFLEDGSPYNGWLEMEDGFWYFDEDGCRVSGDVEIDGESYYFPKGVLYTGWWKNKKGTEVRFFGEDGIEQFGWLEKGKKTVYLQEDHTIARNCTLTIDGEQYQFDEDGDWKCALPGPFYENGKLLTGRVQIGDKYYCLDEKGMPLTGFQHVGGSLYYYPPCGYASVGLHKEAGETYYTYKDGQVVYGFMQVEDQLHYFVKENGGAMAKNTTMGQYRIDSNGVCTLNWGTITKDNVSDYIKYLLKTYGSSPREIYNYVVKNYTFKYYEKTDVMTMALRFFNNGYGACWDFAAATEMMLNAAGYKTLWVRGESAIRSEHDWLLVEIEPGVWRHMDTMRRQLPICLLTDDELYAYNGVYDATYKWDRSKYPAANKPAGTTATTAAETTAAPRETTKAASETTAAVKETTKAVRETTKAASTTAAPTTAPPTTAAPTTAAPTTAAPTTAPPETTTQAPPTQAPTTTEAAPTEPATEATEPDTEASQDSGEGNVDPDNT